MNKSHDGSAGSGERRDIPGSVPVLTFGSVGSSIEPISGDLYSSCIPYPTALAPSVPGPQTTPAPPVSLSFGAWLSNHFEKFGKGGAFVPDDKHARCLTIAKQWYDNPNLKKGSPGQEGTAKERAWLKERGWVYSPDCVAPDGTFRAEGLWAPPVDEGGQRRYVVRASEVQKVIEEKHQAVGHLKRDKCWPLIRSTYVGVPKAAVEAFPLFCPECVNANSPEAKISKRLTGGGRPPIHSTAAKRHLDGAESPRSTSLLRRQVNYKTVTANDGVSLAYERHGQPVGPVVLLIHGWSGSRQYFAPAIALLGASCQVITVDLRHHGDSGRPAHGFHVARFAADLNDLMTALDLKDVFVVGTSMGAAVIWSYIELYRTSRLAGAVFVDQAPLQNLAEDWKLGSKGCYDAASLAVLQLKLTMDPKGFAQGNIDCCATKEIAPAMQEVLINESLRCDPVALGKIMADHTQLDWRPILPTIDIPCLNLVGRLSGVFPWEGCAAVGQLIPDCKTVFFEDCNHWLYLEEPQKFADLLVTFTNSHTRQNIVHESSA